MNFALKSALKHFEQSNGELLIGGKAVSSFTEEYGTPLYIYDREIIEWRHQSLRKTMPANLQIYYAIKANPNIEVIQTMGMYYDGFDIASQGEMEKAIAAGISPEVISFTGPGKTIDELCFAVERDIGSISVESEREVEHLKTICKSLGKSIHVLIRVNPDFELTQSGMKMAGGAKQFGIDSDLVPALIEKIRNDKWIQFEGIHIFSGSQNLHADELLKTFRKILEYADDLSSLVKIGFNIINMGGGFGIPYFTHENDLDLQAVGCGLTDLLNMYQLKMPGTTFNIELGRFLVGECGVYLCRILYRKVSHNRVFLIMDGGMHHHLAASGNFGQSLVRRPMPLTVANKLDESLERVTVVGVLCTPLDTFGMVDIPKGKEGDLMAVLNSGAYGLSASPTQFLSHKIPVEILV